MICPIKNSLRDEIFYIGILRYLHDILAGKGEAL